MGPREFADYILPPFEHAVRVGRVRSVMNSYTDIDGIPVASDPALLTEVLAMPGASPGRWSPTTAR